MILTLHYNRDQTTPESHTFAEVTIKSRVARPKQLTRRNGDKLVVGKPGDFLPQSFSHHYKLGLASVIHENGKSLHSLRDVRSKINYN